MSKHTSLEQRKMMIRLAEQGLTNRQIAERLGISFYTVRKWRRRYRDGGEEGLHSHMGRPRKGTLSTFPATVRSLLLVLRRTHRGCGPVSLLAFLRQDPEWKGKRLPSRSRVAAFLKEQGLVQSRQPHSPPPSAPKVTVSRPHMEWEMDAQVNVPVEGLGRASVLNLVDVFTGLHVAALLCPETRKPDGACYRSVCRMAFSEFGLPEQISLDHDTAFLGGSTPSPFPSDFLLWLTGLVKVRFISAPPPREHARVEGRHRWVNVQALEGRVFTHWTDAQRALNAQRQFTNATYPVPKLAHKSRLEAFPEARHSGRIYSVADEASLLALEKTQAYLAEGLWYRQANAKGRCSLGGRAYGLGKAWAGRRVAITYKLEKEVFHFAWQDESIERPAKWLTQETLMAKGVPHLLRTTRQLPLPFAPPFGSAPRITLGYDFSKWEGGTT